MLFWQHVDMILDLEWTEVIFHKVLHHHHPHKASKVIFMGVG